MAEIAIDFHQLKCFKSILNDIAAQPCKTNYLSLAKPSPIQPANSLGTFKWAGKPHDIAGIHTVQDSPGFTLLLKYRH